MNRRVIFIIMLLLAVALMGACGPAQEAADEVLPTRVPSPTPEFLSIDNAQRVALMFLDAWTAGDFDTMYDLISLASQQATPEDTFRALYERSHQEMTLQNLSYDVNVLARDENNPRIVLLGYDATFNTNVLGQFTDSDRTLQIVSEPSLSTWRVAWSPDAIFSGMSSGQLRLQSSIPRRASIYDHEGVVLADQNGRMVVINVVQQDIPDMAVCLSTLSQATGDSIELVQARLNRFQPDWQSEAGTLEPEAYITWEAALVRDCLAEFDYFSTRRYINGELAPHILGAVGYLDEAGVVTVAASGFNQDAILGRSGIELSWDETLRGQPGGSLVVVTPAGIITRQITTASSEPARSVYLTIDADLQNATLGFIRNAYEANAETWGQSSNGGAAIVMDVRTGAILAMVSWPTFDANALAPFPAIGRRQANLIIQQLQEDTRRPLLNRATQGVYATGSIMKIVTSSAVADSGVYTLDQRFVCTGLWSREDRFVRTDWLPGGHGALTLASAITQSCNPYFYEAGWHMYQRDPDLMSDYARRMGLGSLTGLTDIVEVPGFIGDSEWARVNRGLNWSVSDVVNMAIGQGEVQVTPLQILRIVAAVANGGTLYRPQLVESVRLIDEISYQMTPEAMGDIGIRNDVLDVVRQGMCDVTRVTSNAGAGTASHIFRTSPLQSLGVCGKTGTAQDSPRPRPHAWFGAYAPRDNPEIAVVVIIENAGDGSAVAAPITREIMEYYFFGETTPLY